jgi:hypothetical protein
MKIWIVENFSRFDELSEHIGMTTDGELIQKRRKIPQPNQYRGKPTASMKTTEAVGAFWERILEQLIPLSERQWRPHDIIFDSSGTLVWIEVKTSHIKNRSVIREGQMSEYEDYFGLRNVYYASVFYDRVWTQKIPRLIYIFPLRTIVYFVNSSQKTGNKKSTSFYGLTPHKAKKLYDLVMGRRDIFFTQEYQTSNLSENPEIILRIVDYKDSCAHILSLDPSFKW